MMRSFRTWTAIAAVVATGSACGRVTTETADPPEAAPFSTAQRDTSREVTLSVSFDSLGADVRYCERFFYAFPGSFSEFVRLYGYRDVAADSVVYGPLYNVAYDHVGAFTRSPCIARVDVARKLVELSVGGDWQADAVSYLQQALLDLVIDESELFASQYGQLNRRQRGELMRFLFDGPGSTETHEVAARHLAPWPDIVAEADAALDSVANAWVDH